MIENTQISMLVCHSNGDLLVQITDQSGDLLGWADGAGE